MAEHPPCQRRHPLQWTMPTPLRFPTLLNEQIQKKSGLYLTEFRSLGQASTVEIEPRSGAFPLSLIQKGKTPRKRLFLTLFR